MNPHPLTADYHSLVNNLEQQVNDVAVAWPAVKGFWERWCKEHLAVTHILGTRDASAQSDEEKATQWSALLKQRQRMVSGLGQGLNADACSLELRTAIKSLLADHDKAFVSLLQKELERVKEQMTQAFAIRKTVSAYAQTAQYRGE